MRRMRMMAITGVVATMLMYQGQVVGAQAPGALVSTAWVAERLNDPRVAIFHIGPVEEYDKHHVAGAQRMLVSSMAPTSASGLTLQMPDMAELRTLLEGLGVSDDTRIVIYSATGPGTSLATRAVLTLQQAGLGDRTHLMQGGLPTWLAQGRPTSTTPPAEKKGSLRPLSVTNQVVTGDEVEAARSSGTMRIVDARAPAFYDGVQVGGSRTAPHKTGHIDGAVNVPFNSTFDAQGRFKSPEELRAIFAAAGVKPGEPLIVYCHIGQQATATIFAARLAGFDARLYDGSFEDWSKRPGSAVSTTPAIKK